MPARYVDIDVNNEYMIVIINQDIQYAECLAPNIFNPI